MNNPANLAPKMLHPENISQGLEQKSDEKPWERKKNEPANWYMRFQVYLNLGTKRSLQAAVSKEPNQKAAKGSRLTDVSVPGSWKRASKLWNWVERAKSYDLHIQEQQAQVMRISACNYEYSSRAMRIMELNNLVNFLESYLKAGISIKNALAIVARIQSIFHDIDAEISKYDMEDEADSSALLNVLKKRASEQKT